ncbi:DEAD/DEAH box helicase [Flavihumibacter profundi]|uniref:DEAD/DEAH box helicase n=1 Tax=Flavihumibacter profundi TaxID=2716883 RepID=UPI001CC60524|nr:DEAD/DEAH box helicase [Flavihumibacter profundi]MBZ5857506.1 DEAD/DEAH box helicase [Flavihumibacter profundi]
MIKPETKTGIFIKPSRLKQRWSPLEAIHITRSTRGIDYAREGIDPDVVKKYFSGLPAEARQALSELGDLALQQTVQQFTRTHAKQKAGTSLTAYIDRSLLRVVHQLFLQLLPAADACRWYNQVVNPATGNHLMATCLLKADQPSLSFRVNRDEAGLFHLNCYVRIAGQLFDLKVFVREYFFLLREKEYFLLSFLDYQTLQWLDANDPAVYADDPVGFSEQVLKRLKDDYLVEMGDLLDKQVIEAEPVNGIYLSEISGSFLMLTPRWNYDGFWVEGPWQHSEEFTRNGEIFVVKRHLEKEKSFHDTIQNLHPNFSRQFNGVFNLPFAEAKKKHWFLKVYHQLLEANVELLGMELLKHFRYSPDPVETEMRILGTVGSTMQLFVKVCFGKEEIPLAELQKLLLAGQKSLLLKDHSIGVLPEEWMDQYSLLLKHGKVTKNEISVPQWILLGMEQGKAVDSARPVISREWWQRWLQWQQQELAVYTVPEQVHATLRPYQQKGFEWLCLLSEIDAGACLADDMGLGKTLQTICFLAWLAQSTRRVLPGGWTGSLIVCPASLLHNWRAEFEKFAPEMGSYVYHGSSRDMDGFYASGAQVLITSYGTLRADFGQLQSISWQAVILDESHTIKNPSAQVTKAVYQLKAKARVALSGTPVMNNTFDLYAQLQFLVPGLFGGPEFFRKEYAHPIDRERNEEKIRALQKFTAPFVLRRTKQQVATDLPPKTESVLWCEMGTEQKACYEETRAQIRDSLFLNIKTDGLNKSKLSILQGMQKLRQICAAPQLLNEPGISAVPSAKAELLIEELQYNLRNNKVLVFSQFKGMLHLLGNACRKAGLAYYHFDGDTPPARRSELVAQFQEEGNDVNIFLISLKAGNTGLTLTAADYVFLVDPWWNTAVQQQAIDRAYRIGQTKNVFAYQMICKDSIEEKIVELQERKKALSDALISEDEGFIKQLTEEDIRYLFS